MQSTNSCEEMQLLIQADIDGELRAAEAAAVISHRKSCANCERFYQQLCSLQNALREDLDYQAPSAAFRARLNAKIAHELPTQTLPMPRKIFGWRSLPTFGAGAALAASLFFLIATPTEPRLVDAVVAEHIRALQPGHLLDVASTDQHNVKPWFDGRIDFAPPVKNLAAQGFPLQGGRLDYLNGRSVAALVYYRNKHAINLFIYPDTKTITFARSTGFERVNGYNVNYWRQDGMTFWAVSDLNQAELDEFASAWRTSAP